MLEQITSYLQKYRTLTPSFGARFRERAAEAISREIGADISKESISMKGKTMFIQTGSAAKNTIFIKKKKILGLLNKELHCRIADIR